MISLKKLHYALAVGRHKHFRMAAEDCYVSQSTLSAAIAELEDELGVALFERNNKKVLVTPIGQAVLQRAEAVLVQIRDIEQLAKSHLAPLSYPLRLGVIPTIGPYLLPKVLPALQNSHPQLELSLLEEQSATLTRMVRGGELDTAIIALPYAVDGLLTFPFWRENFFAVCHQQQPLAALQQIDQSDLQQTSLLLLKEGHCLTDHALAVCQLPRPQKANAYEGTSLFTLVQMAAGRMGTTLVPEMALSSFLPNSPSLVAIPLNEPGPHREIAFVVRPNYPRLGDIEVLKNNFAQTLTEIAIGDGPTVAKEPTSS